MDGDEQKALQREVLLAFWKIHVLHHADAGTVVGHDMLQELRRHGYEVSPGTLYPLLARMEDRGWLRCKFDPTGGRHVRKEYSLTKRGRGVLARLRVQVEELYREVVLGEEGDEQA